MKPFAKHIAILLLITIGLLYLLDTFYTSTYERSSPRNKFQYLLSVEDESFDIVFLGSSRVANHIDTKLFNQLSKKRTINLGTEGAQLNDNLLQLKLMLEKNAVSTVFLQVDENFERETPSIISMSQAMPFIGNKTVQNHLEKYLKNYNQLSKVPFYRYAVNDPKIGFRELTLNLIGKKPKVDPANGFIPKYGNKSLKGGALPKEISDRNKVLDEIKEFCQKKNVRLVLFVAPYCGQTKNLDYITKLKEKIPGLLDFSEGYSDDLFVNCGHLNNKGAKSFTTQLYQSTKNTLED